ncbi:MAG: FAD-binding protein [Proteobacteria bacterium]|nr:FAD-binding protein [Pseudomonadota bacterium]NIS70442.1 FAD-binding protein [Pseudomonadota bacterium]
MYQKITESILRRLVEISGPKAVFTDEENLEKYSRDETIGLSHRPDIVVKPATSNEITEIMHLANRENLPITPRGLGTGLSGGAIPLHGGIVLSCENMNSIIEIDRENLMVTAAPGVITGELQAAVESEGLFYPPDPASSESCSIGGNVAEGAGGSRAVRYGTTKDYVSGLEIVLPNGEMIQTGGKVVKDVTGYNLTQLIVGSEGTLGVVTQVVLRLIPLPTRRMDFLIPYGSVEKAAQTVSEIIEARIVPTAIEFMENSCFDLAEDFTKKKLSFREAAAHLLITIDGNHERAMEESRDRIGEICERNGAHEILVATSRSAMERMWEGRKCLFEAANHVGGIYKSLDVVVPRNRIAALVRKTREVSEKHRIRAMSFGHAGDGNVHVLLFKGELPDEAWERQIDQIQKTLYSETIQLGGKITAEHGIGLLRKSYLSMNLDSGQIQLLKRLKKAFDPKNILNPGKIFDL